MVGGRIGILSKCWWEIVRQLSNRTFPNLGFAKPMFASQCFSRERRESLGGAQVWFSNSGFPNPEQIWKHSTFTGSSFTAFSHNEQAHFVHCIHSLCNHKRQGREIRVPVPGPPERIVGKNHRRIIWTRGPKKLKNAL